MSRVQRPRIVADRKIGDLEFVDRYAEIEMLTFLHLSEQRRILSGSLEKATLVTAAQAVGSGKTTLGKNVVSALQRYKEIGDQHDWYKEIKHNQAFKQLSIFEAYANAKYVMIDMAINFRQGNMDDSLANALFHAMQHAIDVSVDSQLTWEHLLQSVPRPVMQEVIEYFQGNHPEMTFFLHFDEVGILEDPTMDIIGMRPHNGDLTLRLERYYILWNKLKPLLEREGVYVFVTDKRPAFALIGRGLSKFTPPTLHHYLVLGGLKPQDILEAFEKSTLQDGRISLTSLITVGSDCRADFGKELCVCSGGLPKLVKYGLQGLCELQTDPLPLNSREDIVRALDTAFSKMSSAHHQLFTYKGDGPLQDLYLILVVISLLNQPVSVDALITLPGITQQLRLLDVIDQFGIYLDIPSPYSESVGEIFGASTQDSICHDLRGTVMLKFGKWLVNAIAKEASFKDMRFHMLAPLMSMAELLDNGAPLEWLLKLVMLFSLGSASTNDCKGRTWSQHFKVFEETIIAESAFEINPAAAVSFVPGVGEQRVSSISDAVLDLLAQCPSASWGYKMHETDWPRVFDKLIHEQSVVHPAPKSASPDMLYSGRRGEPTIAWAAKLNKKGNPIQWKDIQDEINKAIALTVVKPVCLVIAAMNLGAEVNSDITSSQSSRLVVGQGNWKVEKGKLVKGTTRDNKLQVPPKMEVVILSSLGLDSFLGKSNVDALQTLLECRGRCRPDLFFSALSNPAGPSATLKQ